MSEKASVGLIMWTDLTVENAEQLRDFYSAVVGWTSSGVDMGGYNDFNMNDPETGKPIAGVCYARGGNADADKVFQRRNPYRHRRRQSGQAEQ